MTADGAGVPEAAAAGGPKAFEPRLLAFCCNWCAYAGADLAGVSRVQYPTNVRIVRVMCSGRVDPVHIISAFRKGADGVLVAGCHPGDCHYINGNDSTKVRVMFLKGLLEKAGLDPERLRLEWVAGSEGAKFGTVIMEMVDTLRRLGPLDLGLDREADDRIGNKGGGGGNAGGEGA